MRRKEATTYREAKTQEECRHHWVIETAAGPVSRGVCKLCGAHKEFGNYLPDCLGIEKDDYREWAESPRREKGRREPSEGIFPEIGGGDRNAVTAGA